MGSERSRGSQRYVLRYNVASAAGTGSGRGGREGQLQAVDERRSMNYSAYDGGVRSQAPAGSQASTSKPSRYSEGRGVGHEKPVTVVSGSPAPRYSESGRHSESGRSHASKRSDSTIKPPRTSSKAGTERQSGGTVVSMKSDRKSTTVSERARRVPLPESVVGSVAPSDSISNIGMRSHYSRRDVY